MSTEGSLCPGEVRGLVGVQIVEGRDDLLRQLRTMRHSTLEDVDVAEEAEPHERLAPRVVCQHVEVEPVTPVSQHVHEVRVNRHPRREVSKPLVGRGKRLRAGELTDQRTCCVQRQRQDHMIGLVMTSRAVLHLVRPALPSDASGAGRRVSDDGGQSDVQRAYDGAQPAGGVVVVVRRQQTVVQTSDHERHDRVREHLLDLRHREAEHRPDQRKE